MAALQHLPPPIHESYDWQFDGACLGADAEVFFSPEYERGIRRTEREDRAKLICARCPVAERCLEFALQTREAHGIWGGLTAGERERLFGHQRLAG